MRLRSRGLGRKELVMDFREYEVVREEGELVVVGTIRDPVNWDFTIRICEDDFAGLMRLALRPAMLATIVRVLFRRRKANHWNQEHAEHLAEGHKRRAIARENAVERARACMAQPPDKRRSAVRAVTASAEPIAAAKEA